MSADVYTAGVILASTQNEDDHSYTVTQLEDKQSLLPPAASSNVKEWEITIAGIIKIRGYVDLSNLRAGVEIYIAGVRIGEFYGDLKQGIVINVNVGVAKGTIKFYLKNGKELWVKVDIKILFGPTINEDIKIITLPI